MILTFKVRHGRDFSDELTKARKVAEFAAEHHTFTTKDVKHLGLKAAIANQILRKYGRNKTLREVHRVNLTINGYFVKMHGATIRIPCLKLSLPVNWRGHVPEKINQVELDREFAYISVTVKDAEQIKPLGWLGVDMNTTGHCAVAANPMTGKILKLGKMAHHIHKKYRGMRRAAQKKGKLRLAKKIRNRESRIVRDINQKISSRIVGEATKNNLGIKVEGLTGIRQTSRTTRSFRYSLNSWSFFQLKTMLEYKAKLHGIPIASVDPAYTSQDCSRCGTRGIRNDKRFECPKCGHLEHADVNAAFNIASRAIAQLQPDRDGCKGSIDTPGGALP